MFITWTLTPLLVQTHHINAANKTCLSYFNNQVKIFKRKNVSYDFSDPKRLKMTLHFNNPKTSRELMLAQFRKVLWGMLNFELNSSQTGGNLPKAIYVRPNEIIFSGLDRTYLLNLFHDALNQASSIKFSKPLALTKQQAEFFNFIYSRYQFDTDLSNRIFMRRIELNELFEVINTKENKEVKV
jgi:hypothetical protein